jgi:hypothetical protein
VARYSDEQIKRFIEECKPLDQGWETKVSLKNERSGKHRSFEVTGNEGSRFSVILRQGKYDLDSFSAILGIYPQGSNKLFRLRRYDGNDHAHTNSIEGDQILYGYHIHYATERYQDAGKDEDEFALAITRYSNLNEAFSCLLEDCNFLLPSKQQLPAFGWLP